MKDRRKQNKTRNENDISVKFQWNSEIWYER
jgi:hypothetical protein